MAITGDNISVLYCEKCGRLVGRQCTLEDGKKFLEYSGIIIYDLVGIVACPKCGQPNCWTWLGQMPYATYVEAHEKVCGKDAPIGLFGKKR